jgi:hypothetical protein
MTEVLRLTASLLAFIKVIYKSVATPFDLVLAIADENEGIATAANMPTIPIVTTSSTKVKPAHRLFAVGKSLSIN